MGMIFSCDICEDFDSARKKAADPGMTLKDNPLVNKHSSEENGAVVSYNMGRLRRDAHMRTCPVRGAAYSAIMDTRMKEGK